MKAKMKTVTLRLPLDLCNYLSYKADIKNISRNTEIIRRLKKSMLTEQESIPDARIITWLNKNYK